MMSTHTNLDVIARLKEYPVPEGMFPDTYRALKLDLARLARRSDASRNRKRICGARQAPTMHERRNLKTQQAAEYLGISQWKLRNLVQSGQIPCIFGDGTSPWLFDKRDLDSWIDRTKKTL